ARITKARRASIAVPSGTSVVGITPSFSQKGMTGSIRSTTRTGVALRKAVTGATGISFAISVRDWKRSDLASRPRAVNLENRDAPVLKKSGGAHLGGGPFRGRQPG